MSRGAVPAWPALRSGEVHVWRLDRDAHAVRRVAAGYLRCRPRQVRLDVGAFGQPRVSGRAGAPPLWVSVTGTRHGRLLAATSAGPVGLDAEDLEPGGPPPAPAGSWCSPTERAALSDLPADERPAAALLTWTCKEAVLKALGTGLALAPARLDTTVDGLRPRLLAIDGAAADGWTLRAVPGLGRVLCTVAVRCRAAVDVRLIEPGRCRT